ncbi:hypothetical protein IW262DRAFT_29316 [Armillaria fumosa]|nr:hypothetical protein IW262DRAFT_29316 [Armillaria fumosa]
MKRCSSGGFSGLCSARSPSGRAKSIIDAPIVAYSPPTDSDHGNIRQRAIITNLLSFPEISSNCTILYGFLFCSIFTPHRTSGTRPIQDDFCIIPREEHDIDAGALIQPHLEPYSPTRRKVFLYYARSAWEYVKLAIYRWMHRKALRKVLSANRKSRSSTGQFSEVMISSQTEIGQTPESIEVPTQRAYIGNKPVIPSSLADTPCSSLGIQGLLDLLNSTLRTSYTLNTPSLSSVLKDCIAKYDFGTAYSRLRSA